MIYLLTTGDDIFSLCSLSFSCTSSLSLGCSITKSKPGISNSSLLHCLSSYWWSYCANHLGLISLIYITLTSNVLSVISGILSPLLSKPSVGSGS